MIDYTNLTNTGIGFVDLGNEQIQLVIANTQLMTSELIFKLVSIAFVSGLIWGVVIHLTYLYLKKKGKNVDSNN